MRKVVLNELGRVKLSDFKKLIATARKTGNRMGIDFSLCGISYKAYFLPERMMLLLNWFFDGEEYVERILFREAESNLGLNPVLYFVCPYSGKSCRKLFTDGRKFFSMHALKDGFTYQERNASRRDRLLSKGLKEPPESTNRKPYYRGELTPYGRKLLRYYREMDEAEKNLRIAIGSFRRKGRPKGSSDVSF